MTSAVEERVAAFRASPTGSVFLLLVREHGIDPTNAAQPAIATQVAAVAVQMTLW